MTLQRLRTRLAALGLALLGLAGTARAAEKPSIVFILADDLGYSDLGCYGGEIATPNLDQLAAGGVRFTQFYNTARCWPSRAALLSGYYAQQVNRDPAKVRPKWAALLPDLLKPAGYRSYHSGKWHVDGPVLKTGFEHSYQIGNQTNHFSPHNDEMDDKRVGRSPADAGYYSSVDIARHGSEWLTRHEAEHKGEPFFLYLAFTAPHFPVQALPEDIARYRDRYLAGWDAIREGRWNRQKGLKVYEGALSALDPGKVPGWNLSESDLLSKVGPGEVGHAVPWDTLTAEQKRFQATKMAIHAAMVDRMDREIGKVLKQLKDAHAEENTIVFFASDNGASAEMMVRGSGHDPAAPAGSEFSHLCLGPGWSSAANTPFRLHKYWTHEGGISTPLVVRWPAGIAARGELRHSPGHLVDIVPTLLELVGLPAPATFAGARRPPLPGRSLVPAFAADVTIPRPPIFFSHEGNRALRDGDWKIVAAGSKTPWSLYNLADDRAEAHDLAESQPEKVKELGAKWEELSDLYRREGAGEPIPVAANRP